MYTIMCKIAGEKLLYNIGGPAWHFGMTQKGKMEGRGGILKQKETCVIVVDFDFLYGGNQHYIIISLQLKNNLKKNNFMYNRIILLYI